MVGVVGELLIVSAAMPGQSRWCRMCSTVLVVGRSVVEAVGAASGLNRWAEQYADQSRPSIRWSRMSGPTGEVQRVNQ